MSDVHEAAERLRRMKRGDRYEVVYGPLDGYAMHREGIDRDTVINAYLAEHPSDDGEPVTEEWLRSVGFERDAWHPYQFREDTPIDVRCVPDLLLLGHRSDEWDVKKNPTRGDVRRLLSALGIEFK